MTEKKKTKAAIPQKTNTSKVPVKKKTSKTSYKANTAETTASPVAPHNVQAYTEMVVKQREGGALDAEQLW